MASLIESLQQRTGVPNERARILQMTEGDADVVLDALSPETRRETFRALFVEPGTATELAERLDTSVQNVHYHLTNLQEAGLVESIDTIYSEKGNEMTIYGPASDPLVFVGNEEAYAPVKRSVTNVVGGLGLLAVASLLVQVGAEGLLRAGTGEGVDFGPASVAPTDATAPDLAIWLVYGVFEPGLLFFTGCLAIAGAIALAAWR